MAETVQASQQDGHFNESIVNEEILEDMKKNRIDHMKYLPDMEQLEESDVMDQVISAMNAYDYDKYTEADVRRALAHDNRTPEDFQALLSPAALPLLEEIAQAAQKETRKHFGNSGSGRTGNRKESPFTDAGGRITKSISGSHACLYPGKQDCIKYREGAALYAGYPGFCNCLSG